MKIEITEEMLSKFKAAWHEADEAGKTGDRVRAGLEAALADVQVPDATMWINAFGCVRLTDDFAEGLGRDVIQQLVDNGRAKIEPLDPWRSIVLKVTAS